MSIPGFTPAITRATLTRLSRRLRLGRGVSVEHPADWVRAVAIKKLADGRLAIDMLWPQECSFPEGLQLVVADRNVPTSRCVYALEQRESTSEAVSGRLFRAVVWPIELRAESLSWKTTHLEDSKGRRLPIAVSNLVLSRFCRTSDSTNGTDPEDGFVPMRTVAGRLALHPLHLDEAFLSKLEWRSDRWWLEVTAPAHPDDQWALLPHMGTKKGATIPLSFVKNATGDQKLRLQGELSVTRIEALQARSSGIWEFALTSRQSATVVRIGPHPHNGAVPQTFPWARGSDGTLIVVCVTRDGGLAVQFVRPSRKVLGEQDRASVIAANWTNAGLWLRVRLESASGLWEPTQISEAVSLTLRGLRDVQEWSLAAASSQFVDQSSWCTEYPEHEILFGRAELSAQALLAGKEALLSLAVTKDQELWLLPLYFQKGVLSDLEKPTTQLTSGDILGLESNSQERVILQSWRGSEFERRARPMGARVEQARIFGGKLHLRGWVNDDPSLGSGRRVEMVLAHSWGRDELSFEGARQGGSRDSTSGFTFDVIADLESALAGQSLWVGKWTARLRIVNADGQFWEDDLEFPNTWRHASQRILFRDRVTDPQMRLSAVMRRSSGLFSMIVEAPNSDQVPALSDEGPRVREALRRGDGRLELKISLPGVKNSKQPLFLMLDHPATGAVELSPLAPVGKSASNHQHQDFRCEVPRALSEMPFSDRPFDIFITDSTRLTRKSIEVSHLVLSRLASQGPLPDSKGVRTDQTLLLPRRTSEGLFSLFLSRADEPSFRTVELRSDALVLSVLLGQTTDARIALELRSDAAKVATAFPTQGSYSPEVHNTEVKFEFPLQMLLETPNKENCRWELYLRMDSADRVFPIRPHREFGAVPQVVQTKTAPDGRLLVLHTNTKGGLSLQVMVASAQFLREQDVALASDLRWGGNELHLKVQLLALTGSFDPRESNLSFSLGFRGKRNPRLWEQTLRVVRHIPESEASTEFPEDELACDADELADNCRLAGSVTNLSLLVRGKFGTRELPVVWGHGEAAVEQQRLPLAPLELGHHTFLLAESDAKNRLRFVTCPQSDLTARGSPLTAQIKSGVLRGSRFCLTGDAFIPSAASDFTTALLVFRKLSTEESFLVPLSLRVRKNSTNADFSASFSTDLDVHELVSSCQLSHGKWEFRLRLQGADGSLLEKRLTRDLSGVNRRKAFQSLGRTVHEPSGLLVFPELRISGQFVLIVRPFSEGDSTTALRNQTLAILIALLLPNFRDKQTWLITEKKAETAQDNSFVFFKYCYEHHAERQVLYLMRKECSQREKLIDFEERVVDFGSLRHYLLLLRSGVLISSEASSHFVEFDSQPNLFKLAVRIKKYVFLQHGVTAMKNVANIFGRSGAWSADRFITTSFWEQEIAKKYLEYSAAEAPVAGFARWDLLEDKSEDRRQILVMPTWRNWLEHHTPDEFTNSEFFVNYRELLRSERLSQLLEQHDAELLFVMHPYFSKFASKMGELPSRVKAVKAEDRPINELLMESSLLVSDYSSVVWDFFKMKKPVVFFHFDSDEYLKQHGSFVDFSTDLIGPRALVVDSLVSEIESALKVQFAVSPKYSSVYERTFPFNDRKNCERIYSVVEQLQNEPRHEFIQFAVSVLGLRKWKVRKKLKGWLLRSRGD